MPSSDERREPQRNERGVSSIEYAMMATGIALVLALAVGPVGFAVAALFDQVAGAFP